MCAALCVKGIWAVNIVLSDTSQETELEKMSLFLKKEEKRYSRGSPLAFKDKFTNLSKQEDGARRDSLEAPTKWQTYPSLQWQSPLHSLQQTLKFRHKVEEKLRSKDLNKMTDHA